jgi:flagellin
MSLSIHTNYASLVTQNQIGRTNNLLSTAMERLGTGLRINSAADDAAGLQIANRLEAQTRGIGVAIRNSQDAISMMQTAEGALEELTNITLRIKDLAIQAANGVNGDDEIAALDAEYAQLAEEFGRILAQTTYGSGSRLFADPGANPGDPATAGGLLGSNTGITFQIGASADETLLVELSNNAAGSETGIAALFLAHAAMAGVGTSDFATDASGQITAMDDVLQVIGEVRSTLGANINRLDHTINNLTSIQENTAAAKGRITDADFALETSNMTKQQMLMQAGMSVLSQSNQMSGLIMSLLR